MKKDEEANPLPDEVADTLPESEFVVVVRPRAALDVDDDASYLSWYWLAADL